MIKIPKDAHTERTQFALFKEIKKKICPCCWKKIEKDYMELLKNVLCEKRRNEFY